VKRYLLLATVLSAGLARAQPLAAFLQASDEKNIDVRISEETRARAWADLGTQWGGLLPSLSANGGYTRNQYPASFDLPSGSGASTTVETITITPRDQLEANLKAELTLIDVTKWFRVAASHSAAQAAEARDLSTREAVRRSVVTAYYGLAGAQAVLLSAQRALTAAQANFAFVKARAEAGAATELEAQRARAEVARNRQLIAEADATVEVNVRSLETLSGLTPGTLPQPVPDDLHSEAALLQFEAKVPEVSAVVAAELDARSASQQTTAAGALLVPTVSAQATERFTNATGFQNQNALFSAGVNFSWRLDLAGVQGIRAQRATAAQAALQAEKQRQAVRDGIHRDWHSVRSALVKTAAAREQEEAARRAAQLAGERYRVGVATQLDVITTERDALSAEVSRIQAEFGVLIARAQLRLSAGLPLEVTAP
jgi:outer membrane protein TolC